MASRAEHKRLQDERDIDTLEEAVRIIKRRRVIPTGCSQASLLRLLRNEALAIRRTLPTEGVH